MSVVDSGPVTRFKYGEVVKGNGVMEERDDVWVREGKVIDPQRLFYEDRRVADRVVDCRGLIVAPGFIDIQINGAFGIDFSSMEGSASTALDRIASGLLQHGVTSFCPTLVTGDSEYYRQVLPEMKLPAGKKRATVLGVHCEGPFINHEKKGAHRSTFIKNSLSPDTLLQCYGNLDNVKIITLAPELPGAMETIQWLQRMNSSVRVSLGHSVASLSVAEEAVRNGASLITHLFNAMLPFHHRDPGIVGLLTSQELEDRPLYYSLIADGHHTHKTVAKIAYNAKPEGAVLVTDAIAAMGLGNGVHNLGSMKVCVKGGVAKLDGKDTLAGSMATMDYCVREFRKATGCSPAEATQAASWHPAQALGLATKGSLVVGADADLVILDKALTVQATCVGGEMSWIRPGSRFSQEEF